MSTHAPSAAPTDLTGMVVLVASPVRPGGEAIGAGLRERGAVVASLVHARPEDPTAPGDGTTLPFGDRVEVQRRVRAAEEEHGRVDGVVFDARGDGREDGDLIPPEEEWRARHEATVLGAVHLGYALADLEPMPRSVVFLLPPSVREVVGGNTVDSAFGTSVLALAKHLALEWRVRGVRVNAAFWGPPVPGAASADVVGGAETLAFLLSDGSAGVSGAAVPVDGGRSRQLL